MQPVHFLHKHFLFGGWCTLILSVSTSSTSGFHHSACIWSIVSVLLICKGYSFDAGLRSRRLAGWRTQRSSTALPALRSPWWLIYTSLQLPMPLLFTTLSAVCDVGGQSWMLGICAHQYTHHLLFFCNVLNINTICSLRNDNTLVAETWLVSNRARVCHSYRKLDVYASLCDFKLTSFIKWNIHVLAFIPLSFKNLFCFFLTHQKLDPIWERKTNQRYQTGNKLFHASGRNRSGQAEPGRQKQAGSKQNQRSQR